MTGMASNRRGPLKLEVTALVIEPQPMRWLYLTCFMQLFQ